MGHMLLGDSVRARHTTLVGLACVFLARLIISVELSFFPPEGRFSLTLLSSKQTQFLCLLLPWDALAGSIVATSVPRVSCDRNMLLDFVGQMTIATDENCCLPEHPGKAVQGDDGLCPVARVKHGRNVIVL